MGPRLQPRGPALTLGSTSRSGAHLGGGGPDLARGPPRAESRRRGISASAPARPGRGAGPARRSAPSPPPPRLAPPPAAPTHRPLLPSPHPPPPPPPLPRRLSDCSAELLSRPGPERRRRGHRTCSALGLPSRRFASRRPASLSPRAGSPVTPETPRPTTMTTSLQDGQSAAGRAAAQDSPLAAQVCGAAQGRGDARHQAPAPWLHARALLPPPDGTRGCAADR